MNPENGLGLCVTLMGSLLLSTLYVAIQLNLILSVSPMSLEYLIQASHPAYSAMIILPEPELGDTERAESKAVFKRSMNGNAYSHTTVHPNRTYKWTFILTRLKGLEFLTFYNTHSGGVWKVTRADSSELVGNIRINPLILDMVRRGVVGASQETVALEVEFETIQ